MLWRAEHDALPDYQPNYVQAFSRFAEFSPQNSVGAGGQPDAGMFMEIIYFIDNWRNALERERRQPGSLSKLAGRQQLL